MNMKIISIKILIVILGIILNCEARILASEIRNNAGREIKSPSQEFTANAMKRAFSPDINRGYPEYISISISPSLAGVESQIFIGIKPGEKAQIVYRKATISFWEAFCHEGENTDNIVRRMKVQQKNIPISEDLIKEWLSQYWEAIGSSIKQMKDKPPYEVITDSDKIVVEYYTKQNKITISIAGTEDGETELDIKAIYRWIKPIRDYVEASQ
jgi:hypothetical protein